MTGSVIFTRTRTMNFARSARVGYIDKVIDIYSAPLRENSMLNRQRRLFFRVYENR